jgi:hypothetical protein
MGDHLLRSDDEAFWQVAIDHYDHDRVEEAFAIVREHGIGAVGEHLSFYREIEAEAVSRRGARRIELSEWVLFEYLPWEVGDPGPWARRVEKAIAAVSERMGWTPTEKALVAMLAKECDVPWAVHPYGYFADKVPYDKICMPSYLLEDPGEFEQAVAHEYGHVISLNLSQGKAPRWLEEAVSVLLGREFDEEVVGEFARGEIEWLGPAELDGAFEAPDDVDEDDDSVWLAYQQAGLIGRYLAGLGGERRLGDLMRAHADIGLWRGLAASLARRTPTDVALRRVYGLDESRLFEQAFASLSPGIPGR